jgi:hypothetical protein
MTMRICSSNAYSPTVKRGYISSAVLPPIRTGIQTLSDGGVRYSISYATRAAEKRRRRHQGRGEREKYSCVMETSALGQNMLYAMASNASQRGNGNAAVVQSNLFVPASDTISRWMRMRFRHSSSAKEGEKVDAKEEQLQQPRQLSRIPAREK